MKNIRVSKFLRLNEDEREEYNAYFKHAKNTSNKLGIFKARNIQQMQFDQVLMLKTYLSNGEQIKAMSLLFCFQINIPFLGFTRADNYPNVDLTPVWRNITFYFSMPRFLILIKRIEAYFLATNYLGNELINLNKLEEQWQHPSNADMKAATGNLMDEFGWIPTIKSLSLKWGVSENTVLKWPWVRVNKELKLSAVEAKINKRYNEIIERKNKKRNG
jgi:hypothetical protein